MGTKKNFYYKLIRLNNILDGFRDKRSGMINRIASSFYRPAPSDMEIELKKYYNAGGEELRYDYIFDNDSIIFDLGGYEGEWASQIYSRFRSKIYVFEVYKPYAEAISKRFKYNPDIHIFAFGLSSKNGVATIAVNENSTSLYTETGNKVSIELVSAAEFIKKNNISSIDLMKINIEGAEYDLLDHLIETGYHKIIKNLQIQFHNFVPDAIQRMNTIREKLSATHSTTYQFDFVWENWKLNQ